VGYSFLERAWWDETDHFCTSSRCIDALPTPPGVSPLLPFLGIVSDLISSLSAEVLKRETVQRRFTEAKFAESSTQVDTSFSELRAQNTQHTRDFQALSTKISEQFAEQGDIFRLITGDIGLGYSTLRTELASLHSRFSQHQENNHLATVQLLNSLQDQLNTQSALIRVCHSLLFDEVRKSDDKPRQNVEQKSEPTDSITDLDRSRATILPPTSQNRAMRRGAILNDLESAYTGKLLQWLRGLFRLSIDLVSIEGRRHPPSKALLRAISKFGSLFHAYIQELYPLLLQLLLYMKFILPRMMLVANSIAIRSPLQLSIIFEDVLGRAHGLPYHYFRNWHTFTSMLEREFVNCPGEEEVVRGDYRLMNSQFYDDALSEENWEQSVFPGTKIIMSIFVRMLRRAKGQCAREGCAGTLESNGKAKTVWFVDLHNRAGWESDT